MKTIRQGRFGWLAVPVFIASLLAYGVHAQSDRPKTPCSGAFVHDPDGIIAACTTWIAENPSRTPSLARAYTWRGRAYVHNGEPDRAIEDLNRAIEIEPSVEALNNRGAAYRMKGNTVRALADLERSLSLERHEFALLGIAQVHWSNERYDLALRAMDEAMAVRPSDSSLYLFRGNIHRDSGQFARAVQDYDRALELTQLEYVRSERCVALALMGKPEEGLIDCDLAVEKEPGVTNVFLNRGAVYLRLNRPDDAIADFDRILKEYPDDPEALYARGIVRRLKGDIVGSDADFAAVGAIADAVVRRLEKIGVRP